MFTYIPFFADAARYWIATQFLRRKKPLVGGLVVNDRCNLHCRQCRVSNRSIPDASYDDLVKAMRSFRTLQIRTLFLEGGEPFLWRDGPRRLEDIVTTARELGFSFLSMYTNGTLRLETSADTVFVSLDGLSETNDRLRGVSYDRVMSNIARSDHPNVWINYTINALNRQDIVPFCNMVADTTNLKGVFYNFHTPYYGRDELFLEPEQKRRIIAVLLDLKKRNLPVANSTAALRAVMSDHWTRPGHSCRLWADGRMFTCCRAIGNSFACRHCGYLLYAEIAQSLRLRPTALWSIARQFLLRGN